MTPDPATTEALSREQLLAALVQAEGTIEALLRASRRSVRVQQTLSHSQQQTVVDFATIQLDTLAYLSPLYRATLERAEAAEAERDQLRKALATQERATALIDDLCVHLDQVRRATNWDTLTEAERREPIGTEHSRAENQANLVKRVLTFRAQEALRERIAQRTALFRASLAGSQP